jgi:hypothetical protein
VWTFVWTKKLALGREGIPGEWKADSGG